ncbi:phosphatidylinositol 4-kinase Pik1p [Trichomonascus vanleenenianus]|uniref:1-phosphatidylinositol 4-kinase n=1 Tax=Trichomonascus vanleenenianus TaxID=2268995 RepID=UPI003EC98368
MSDHGIRGSGNALLLRFIDSPHFTLFRCVQYLEQHANNVGIHLYLCQKLRSYPSKEIQFFLPQLVQLQVTVETESMALEDLLVDLCSESTHATLLVFWELQAHLTELASDPESYGFQVCKRLYNKLQYVLFNVGNPPTIKLRENTAPALVLASVIAAAPGLPGVAEFIKPLVVSQGRKQRSHVFQIASKLLRSRSASSMHLAKLQNSRDASSTPDLHSTQDAPVKATPQKKPLEKKSAIQRVRSMEYGKQESMSLPNLAEKEEEFRQHSPTPSVTSVASNSSTNNFTATGATQLRTMPSSSLLPESTYDERVKILKTNYFRCQTQFVYALQAISARLLQVPKQARLSALRAELAMLNRDLPAEVDIPMLLPNCDDEATQNRIVRISSAEATVLNSAERVPFLLLVEYLKGDVDFDPDNDANKYLFGPNAPDRRYIFDTTYEPMNLSNYQRYDPENAQYDDEEEKDMADISALRQYENKKELDVQDAISASLSVFAQRPPSPLPPQVVQKEGVASSPRASDLSFSSSYPTSIPSTPTMMNHNQGSFEVTDLATHMRTAAIMLTQLDAGGSKLPKSDISAIKSRIIASMQSMEEHTAYSGMQGEAGERKLENDLKTAGMTSSNSDDPSAANLGEDWEARKQRIRKSSPYGSHPNWDLFSVIAKTGNDLRQEAFACQLIMAMEKIWKDTEVDVWVKRMRILITNDSSGLVETITNGLSIHSIKKALTNASIASGKNPKGTIASLVDHFESKFGGKDSERYLMALDAFVRSLAAYSVICYILQIKDRHNGNILLDNEGHIIHIDFGFLLSNSPGRFGFEAAPFKLTQEYVDLMGGVGSTWFEMFRGLLKESFKALRKNAESIIILVEMMARDSDLPCFYLGPATAMQLRQRFQLQLSDSEVDGFVDNVLIQKSIGSIYTRLYDQYQLLTQGIYS